MTSSKYQKYNENLAKIQEEAKRRWAFHHTSEYDKYMDEFDNINKEYAMATDMFKKNQEDLGMKSHTPIYMWDAATQDFVPLTYEELEERDVIKSVKKEPTMATPFMDDSMDNGKYYVSLTFEHMSAQDVGRLIKNINEFSQMSHISVNHM